MPTNERDTRRNPQGKRGGGPAQLRALLVPLDLAPISDRVVRRVARLPLANDARVTLLHVVPDSLPHADQHEAERDAKRLLAEEAPQLAKLLPTSIRVASVVRTGAVLKEIAAAASVAKAELIVMGRGGGRAVRDLFLGSTAERVIRQGKLPVLVVRLPARSGYSRPALALDLDQAAHEVVTLALRVLQPARPRVQVIHAFTPPFENLSYPSVPQGLLEERRTLCQRQATQELTTLLATSLSKSSVPPADAPAWKLVVRYGPPRSVLAKTVKRLETDLLVLGTRAHTGLAHVFLGTVAGDVLREVTCDVLVVPPKSSRR